MPNPRQRKRSKPGFLVRYLGPSFFGVRNWLLISMLFLLGVALVGGFAVVPLSVIAFSAIIISLKVGALIAFLASVGMGIKAVIDDYTEEARNKKEYFWIPYLWHKFTKDFLSWVIRSPLNFVKFLFGFLLLVAAIVVLVCVCCPAIALAIPGITVVVNFIVPAFQVSSLFAGSWVFPAVFLGVGTMLAYDVLLRVIDVCIDGFHEFFGIGHEDYQSICPVEDVEYDGGYDPDEELKSVVDFNNRNGSVFTSDSAKDGEDYDSDEEQEEDSRYKEEVTYEEACNLLL